MTEYLEGMIPGFDVLKKTLRKAVIANEIFPVFAGSALKNKGVQLVLDAVVDYLTVASRHSKRFPVLIQTMMMNCLDMLPTQSLLRRWLSKLRPTHSSASLFSSVFIPECFLPAVMFIILAPATKNALVEFKNACE